jgi:hypothetical protein
MEGHEIAMAVAEAEHGRSDRGSGAGRGVEAAPALVESRAVSRTSLVGIGRG